MVVGKSLDWVANNSPTKTVDGVQSTADRDQRQKKIKVKEKIQAPPRSVRTPHAL